MCPHQSEEARRLWSKACNFHRGTDPTHHCSNPDACERRMEQAVLAEFQNKWA